MKATDASVSDPDDGAKDRQFVTALARGLKILRCFTQTTPQLGTSEIAAMVGLPQPTVWRLCHTLIQEGYLVQARRSEKLRPGIPVLSLGFAAIASMPIGELARDDMQGIADRYQGAVSLGMRDGLSMIYLQRVQGSMIMLRDMSVGSRVSLASSATGWAYIAGLEGEERAQLIRELAAQEPAWATLAGSVEEALRGYETTGYVVNRGSLHPQINAVAVPVKSHDGQTLLSLSSGGLSQLFDDKTLDNIGRDLKEVAARLQPALTRPA